MANFETEQKTALPPLEKGDDPSSSIAICEDNLAALLRVMNGSAKSEPAASESAVSEPAVSVQADVVPAEVSVPPAAKPPVAETGSYPSPEPERPLEPERTPEAVSGPEAVSRNAAGTMHDAVVKKDPVAANDPLAHEVVIVEDQADDRNRVVETVVVVEAAIVADAAATEKGLVAQNQAIAEKGARAVRPEEEAPQTPEAPIQPPAEIARVLEPEPVLAGGETPAPVADALPKVASQLALLSSIKQRRTMTVRPEPATLPVPETNAPAPPVPAVEPAPTPKTAAPAKRKRPEPAEVSILLPIPDPAKEKPEPPRGNTYLDRMDELAKAPAPWTPPSHAGPAMDTVVTSMYTRTYQDTAKQKSFAKSGTGLTLIAGTVLALGVTGYFLLGFDFKSAAIAPPPQPVVEESVPEKKPASKHPSGERSTVEKSPATAGAATAAAVDRKIDEKSAPPPAAQPPVRTDPVQKDIAPKDIAQKADTGQTVVVGNSVSIVARTFTPPATGTRRAESPILEAPPVLAPPSSAPATLPAGVAPLPPPAPAPPSNTAVTRLRQINVTGKVQAAKLMKQVKPAYPALARATRVQGTVRFRVTIAADGQIKNVISLGGPSPLVQAATDAVRQWRYQPTLVNGEAVEVVTEIDVAFTL